MRILNLFIIPIKFSAGILYKKHLKKAKETFENVVKPQYLKK